MLDGRDLLLIHQLLGRYGHLLDARDWDAFVDLFTADAVVDYTAVRAPKVCRGHAEIIEYFGPANHPPAHHVTNIVADENADAPGPVQVHSKFIVPFTQAQHVPVRIYGGDYHDEVVKGADGRWRFSSKSCVGRWQYTPDSGEHLPVHRRTF